MAIVDRSANLKGSAARISTDAMAETMASLNAPGFTAFEGAAGSGG